MATERVRGTGHPAPRGLIIGLFAAYACVILALTTLKAFFRIGLLWRPERQRVRSLELVPFDNFFRSPTWFGPVFDAVGNVAFFVPFGWLVAVLAAGTGRARLVCAVARQAHRAASTTRWGRLRWPASGSRC